LSIKSVGISYERACLMPITCTYLNKILVGRDVILQREILYYYRLMRLFEGGILSKITEEEYQKLNDKLMGSEKFDSTSVVIEPVLEGSEPRQEDDDKQLTIAMSMKTLQGAFYVLAIGSILAGAQKYIIMSSRTSSNRRFLRGMK